MSPTSSSVRENFHSTGASGTTIPEPDPKPLGDGSHSHQFLLSSNCSINLQARDLILKMFLQIECSSQGLRICKQPETVTSFLNIPTLLYIFEWLVYDRQTEYLLRKAHGRVPPTASYMSQQHLHCTVRVTTDPNDQLGDDFLISSTTSLHVTHMCWSDET